MKWTVHWIRPDGMEWRTCEPLNHARAAAKVRALMRKRPNGPTHAVKIWLVPEESK